MINPKELRIGSIIKHPRSDFGIIIEIGEHNDSYYARFKDTHEGYYLDSCELIPLTEDLLCKCPIFHKSHNEQGNTFHVLKDGWDVLHTIEHWTETENPKYKGRFHWNGIGEVKYLHEVQNWYYMFMKKELEINL